MKEDDPGRLIETIRYELDGRLGMIDGWVLDSPADSATRPAEPAGDEPPVVKFMVRDGQAKLTRQQIWSPEEVLRDHRQQGLREGKRFWSVWTGDDPVANSP